MTAMAAPPPTAETSDEVETLLLRRRRRGSRIWRAAAVGAALAVILSGALVAARGLGRDPGLVRSALINKTAPAFRLQALGGGEIDSSTYLGDVVVVNFWASWCVPCREEAPELEAFAQQFSGRDVSVVGVAYNDDSAAAAAFRDRFGLSFPQAVDPTGRTAIDYGVFGVPETFVIDRRGIVMAKLMGAVDAATLTQVVRVAEDGDTMSTSNDRYRTRPG